MNQTSTDSSLMILRLLQEEMMIQFPAFPEAFGQLTFFAYPELDHVFGTDGLQLYFQPDLCLQLFQTNLPLLKQTFLHTHLHCLCLHVIQPADSAPSFWDQNCDLAVHSLLGALWPDAPDCGSVQDSHQFWFRHSTVTPAQPLADGSGGAGLTTASLSHKQLSVLETVQELWQNRLPQQLQPGQSGQHQGHSGAAHEAAGLKRQDDTDYRCFLRQFAVLQEERLLDLDSFDYIPYHYGLTHYTNMPFWEPLEYKEVHRLDEFAIAIDTSGSCSGRIVRRFLEETWTILRQRENFFSKMRLHLIQCDCLIQEHQIFTSVQQWEEGIASLEIHGHGDTDFYPVFTYLEKLIRQKEIRHLRGLLYFTDGDGIFPPCAPAWPTAFVFLNDHTEKHAIPDWAIRLNLHLPEEF